MRFLLNTAFANRHHRALIALVILFMCLLTLASQLEIMALGIIMNSKNGGAASSLPGGGALVEQASAWINQLLPIRDNFKFLALFLVFVALFKAIALFMHRYTTRLVAIRISRDLRQGYFEHIQSLPMHFYQQHNIGGLSSRVMSDASLVAEAINASLINYLQTPFTVLSTLVLCFLTSWQLSLTTFLGLPLILIPIILLAKKVKKISKQIQKNQELFASVLIDFLAGIQTVKVFAMESFSLKKYREHNHKMAALEQKSARYDLSSRPIVHTIGMFFLATALLYGLYGLGMSVADVLVYCGLLYVFYEPIKKFAEENTHIQRGIAAAERMQEVLQQMPQIEDLPGATELTSFNHELEFKDVWFRYQDTWVLKGVNFKVKKGEMVALVGPTGAGKSTIAQLLPRLYDMEKGSILIDGKPLTCYTQNSLREKMGFVPQKPFLFLDTVTENISFGRAFSEEQVREASKRAHADEFISQLPQGYHTELAEAGKNLSGGQQQRLAIARALVKNAPILIMDEATSSLDAVSESHIKEALKQLRGTVTQIIIAHRLSTIEDADRIIYLERGEKVAEGTKEELLKSCKGFQLMWNTMHRFEQGVH